MARQFIYSRISTDKQDIKGQLIELKKLYPQAHIVEETASGKKCRPILEALITSELKPGDTLIVYSIDRIGRTVSDVLQKLDHLVSRQITVIFYKEGIDYSKPVGKLMAGILASVAQMERDRIVERTKYGLENARLNGTKSGRPFGRPSFISKEKKAEALELVANGVTVKEVAKHTGISISYVRKLMKA